MKVDGEPSRSGKAGLKVGSAINRQNDSQWTRLSGSTFPKIPIK
jgi:hypothetical protein